YFPTNLLTSPGRSTLYVTNSDFDLQYNAGTVMAINLQRLRLQGLEPLLKALLTMGQKDTIADACKRVPNPGTSETLVQNPGGPGDKDVTNAQGGSSILYPGPCSSISLRAFIDAQARIGAFASGATFAFRTDDKAGARLFVSVRGDPSITWF